MTKLFIIFTLLILADRVAPESITSDYVSAKYLQSEINTEFIMFTEQWKSIKGYEGYYEVSNLGRVKSKSRLLHNYKGVWLKPEEILMGHINAQGYKVYCLRGGKIRTAHSLVWDAFGGKPRDGRRLQIDHIDGNKTNNNIDNLQLLTNRENVSKGHKQRGKELPTGVTWHNQLQKYRARIRINDKQIHIGVFDNIEEAHLAYTRKLGSLCNE